MDGTHDSPKYVQDYGHFLVTSKNIKGGRLMLETANLISEQDYADINRRSGVDQWDILFSMIGTVGEMHLVQEESPAFAIKNIGLFKVGDELKAKWLYYWLRSPIAKAEIRQACRGTSQQYIPLRSLRNLSISSLTERGVMRKIVKILSAYDDLIENNQQRIALLEESARLLYREWFVHLRFPGHEHIKIIDGLPEGWQQRTLVELAEVIMGQSPKSQFYNEAGDGLPFHQGVTDYGFRFVSHRIYSTAVTKLAEAGDILVSVRAPVGRINITRDKIVLGRGLAAIRSRTENQSFLFYALKSRFFTEDIIGTGAIYAATNKKELESQTVVDPSKRVLAMFEERAKEIDQQITNLTTQNEKLAQARDLLLPRLMNGEFAV